MLDALLGGRWLTASELAKHAGVAAPTASEHLGALVNAQLVARRKSGRHRYHALASPEVAATLESLGRLTRPSPDASRGQPWDERALLFARTCYDHLAGRLGVLITDKLVERSLVSADGTAVTPEGESFLNQLGIDVEALRRTRRSYVRFCLDWSERRDHVAGAVGTALIEALFERRWVVRMDGTRAVRLTLRGRDALHVMLGVPMEQTEPDQPSCPRSNP